MNYEGELRMLCETFHKCRVSTVFVSPGDPIDKAQDEIFRLLFGENARLLTDAFLERIHANTIYRLTSSFQFCYILLRLPHLAQDPILAIGPYLPAPLNQRQMLEIAEKYSVPPQRRKLLENYYAGLPILPETSHLFSLLDTFGERIWGSNLFTLEEINEKNLLDIRPLATTRANDGGDILMQMKLMEERYATENALIRAVSKGQMHKGVGVLESIASMPFEKRLDDPLRNLKNYSIIMNTLLRKAAEQGGVHPLYLDEMSSAFATRIEQLSSMAAGKDLMGEMFRSYCLLVRKHTMKSYSPTVQKALVMIDADLSADLSLRTLAEAQNISASYLSAVFKKETGKTVTDYINSERMQLAAHLLETTGLQVQTVALHCGILDVQYFSKVFKKYIGKTPKEYRESFK